MTTQQTWTLLLSLFFTLLGQYFAVTRGFYTWQEKRQLPRIGFFSVLLLFLGALGVQLGFAFLVFYSSSTTIEEKGWIVFLSIVAAFLFSTIFSLQTHFRKIWKPSKQAFFTGVIGWFLAFPFIVFLSTMLQSFFESMDWAILEQDPVRYLKLLQDTPLLFFLTAFGMVLLVPMTEEILFRGFLQTFFNKYLPRWSSLLLTALIFTLFHFSSSLGLSNLVILVPLFCLSCLLGYLVEKTDSLLSSVTLHAFFNASSILLLLLETLEEPLQTLQTLCINIINN